ncbi:MAG: carboxymuconolactone decarboxylase family protein [Bacteroidota bacterium]
MRQARIEPLELKDIPELAPIMQAAKSQMGFYPMDGMIMARNPVMLKAFLPFVQSILSRGKIDPVLKRLLGIISSSTTGCQYCTAHAAHQAHIRSETDAKIAAVWEFEQSELFSEAEKMALRFALHASMIPNAVDDELMQKLNSFYTEDEIVEMLGVISLYAFLNRWNSTLATPLEEVPKNFILDEMEGNLGPNMKITSYE